MLRSLSSYELLSQILCSTLSKLLQTILCLSYLILWYFLYLYAQKPLIKVMAIQKVLPCSVPYMPLSISSCLLNLLSVLFYCAFLTVTLLSLLSLLLVLLCSASFLILAASAFSLAASSLACSASFFACSASFFALAASS